MVYIDLFRSRARSKGIGFTSRRVTRSPSWFYLRRFSSHVAYFVVRPLVNRYANLRFEKLIARSVYLSLLCTTSRASSRLAQESTQDRSLDATMLNARTRLSYDDECVSARASHLRDTFVRGLSGMGSVKLLPRVNEKCRVNERNLKNVFCILS